MVSRITPRAPERAVLCLRGTHCLPHSVHDTSLLLSPVSRPSALLSPDLVQPYGFDRDKAARVLFPTFTRSHLPHLPLFCSTAALTSCATTFFTVTVSVETAHTPFSYPTVLLPFSVNSKCSRKRAAATNPVLYDPYAHRYPSPFYVRASAATMELPTPAIPLCASPSTSSSAPVTVHSQEVLEHPQNKSTTNEILRTTSPAQPVTSHSPKITTDAIAEIHKETASGSRQDISGTEMDVVDPIYEPDLKEVYYFLQSKTFPVILQIHRTWKNLYLRVQQDTKKMPFVFNLLQVVRSELIEGCSLGNLFLKKHGDRGFDAFHANWETTKNLEPDPPWDLVFSSSDGSCSALDLPHK